MTVHAKGQVADLVSINVNESDSSKFKTPFTEKKHHTDRILGIASTKQLEHVSRATSACM